MKDEHHNHCPSLNKKQAKKPFSVTSFDDFKSIMKNRKTSLAELKKPLIDGIVREGDALLITRPSKIGKTMRMMELASALENGGEWLGFQCALSKVMFLNPEVHEAEFHHREREMFQDIHLKPFTTAHQPLLKSHERR